MAEQLTMNHVIHNAVRRDLSRLDAALAAAPPGNTARARDLAKAYTNLRTELTHHHQQEDRLVFPALGRLGIDRTLLEEMDHEHEAMVAALTDTAAAMDAYAASATAESSATARQSVGSTTEVIERHLAHEEGELDPQVARVVDTEEWKAVEKAFRKQSPVRSGRFFAWLLDGADPDSAAYLRSSVPPPVIFVLTKVFGRGYTKDIAPVWR